MNFLQQTILVSSLLAAGVAAAPYMVQAEVLQGEVESSSQLFRIAPPSNGVPAAAPDFRIGRPLSGRAGTTGLNGNVVDSTAFNTPLTGTINGAGSNGVVQSGQFASAPSSTPAPAPARNFDLGADAGSKELVLAWERWHKQLSQVIYERWTQRADCPGVATIRVTVTRDHQIHADVLDSHGRPEFLSGLMDAIDGLNGNQGLTFPVGSQRQTVSYEADYIAGHDVTPGYSWVHNDYEVVHQNY